MIPITYLIGDATQPRGNSPRIIVHICNDKGYWGKGFVLALSKRWKTPEREYAKWASGYYEDFPFELGSVQFIKVTSDNIYVANLIGQHDIKSINGMPPVRYEAVRAGLLEVGLWATGFRRVSIHMPRIGTGLAGGNWEEIEPIIVDELCSRDIPVFVYDLPAEYHLSLMREYVALVDAQRSSQYSAGSNHHIAGERSVIHDQLLELTKMTRDDDMYEWCRGWLK